MKYQILQLDKTNPNVLKDHCLFASWDELNRTCGFSKWRYKKVYEGEIESLSILTALDDLFRQFNLNHPEDFHGHSMSVSDVVVLDDRMYYCDNYGWVDVKTEETL